jgi:hypothetical protein
MSEGVEGYPGNDIALRRADRFFGVGGLHDRYEQRGDHLIQFVEIVAYLAAAGLKRGIVRDQFLFSVKHGFFGRHGERRTIAYLLDLDSFNARLPGHYSLRPSYSRVEEHPGSMRARRSIWAQWIEARGWPVPPELKTSLLIDAEPVRPALIDATGSTTPATSPTAKQTSQAVMKRRPGNRNWNQGVEKRLREAMRARGRDWLRDPSTTGEVMRAEFNGLGKEGGMPARSTCERVRKAVLAEPADN